MYSRLQQALIALHCTYNVIQGLIREIPLTSLTSQSSHHFHLISSPYCHCTALSRHPVQLQYRHFPVYLISLYTFELFTEFLWPRSQMVRARDTDAGIVTFTTASVTERCLHTLAPAPQQQLPSPDLAPAPVTTERKPAQDTGLLALSLHHHSTAITRWYHTPQRKEHSQLICAWLKRPRFFVFEIWSAKSDSLI